MGYINDRSDDPLDGHPAARSVRDRMSKQRRESAAASADWNETAPEDEQLVWSILATELEKGHAPPSELLHHRLSHGPAPAYFVRSLLSALVDLATMYGSRPIDTDALIATARRLAAGEAATDPEQP